MSRRSALLVTAALLAAMVALVPLGGLAAPSHGTPTAADNASNASVAPGQQMSAVVDVGEAELETEVEGRAFGQALAGADSPAARAKIIKQRVDALDRDVADLEARLDDLQAARANGSLSEGAYRARVTGVAAQLSGEARLANATASASAGLPADVLAANGIDVDAIEQLRQRASELGGPEIAEIARGIAGPAVGNPPGPPAGVPGGPVTPGPPADASGDETAGDNATVAPTPTERPDA